MRITQFLLVLKLNILAMLTFLMLAHHNTAFAENNNTKITLLHATTLALQANPTVAIFLRKRDIESGQTVQVALRPNPTLSGQIEDLRSQNRIATIAISQQLETAGKRDKRIANANINAAIADIDVEIAQADITAKVYAAFYKILAAQQAQALALELLSISTQSKETTAKRVLAGKISPVESTKAQVAEVGLKIDLANANQQLDSSKQQLTSLWTKGLQVQQQSDFIAVGELEKLSNLPRLSNLIAQLPESPQLKKAALAVSQKQSLVAIEQSKQTPDLTLSLGARRNEELGGITQAIIGLSIPIPIFDQNQGNLQSAQSRELQSADEKIALENQIKTELSIAYSKRQLQIEAADMYIQDILPGAQSAYEAARKGFEFGKFSFLEVLDAQRTLFQAKTQYIQTLALAHQATADIYTLLSSASIQSANKE